MASDRLETGMYVAALDRAWRHTPFAGPGMLLSSTVQVDVLAHCCHHVYIDPERSDTAVLPALQQVDTTVPDGTNGSFGAARETLADVIQRLAAAIQQARRHGHMEIAPLQRAASRLVGEVLAREDTCLWLIRLGGAQGLLYRRSLGTAIHAVVFGRHLGLDHTELAHLALGGLLLDIGKIAVPVPILAKPGELNTAERWFVDQHVQKGVSMVRISDTVDTRVMEMVVGHHERIDGKGYPRGLVGTKIPFFARIAGIVDTFDAMTLHRRYAPAVSAHDGLRYLNQERGQGFDAALVDEFVHALGVYPTGTRVKLVDGSAGIVCAQNPEWPLRPAVLRTHDAGEEALDTPRVLPAGLGCHIAMALDPAPLEHEPTRLESAITQH